MVEALADFTGDVVCSRDAEGIKTNVPRRIIKHSPTGFEWGYAGSGPADFALNILSVFIGQEKAEGGGLYQLFKQDFVTPLPQEGGTIPRAEILKWIEVQAAEGKIRHTVTITLEEYDAAALALICERASMERLGRIAKDNEETHRFYETLETIRGQLWEMGYNPADIPQMGEVTG